MKDSNDVNLDRKNYFKFMKTRKIENKAKREEILLNLWNKDECFFTN